jgi:hypothetical protein
MRVTDRLRRAEYHFRDELGTLQVAATSLSVGLWAFSTHQPAGSRRLRYLSMALSAIDSPPFALGRIR